jgi:hypothetical protein
MYAEHQLCGEPGSNQVESLVVRPEISGRPCAARVPESRRGSQTHQLDLSVTEIAIIWILHYGTMPRRPLRGLTQGITEFYPVALDAIQRTETMRGVRQSDLRLIYFKGLVMAQTHPKSEMIDAIRRADRILEYGKLQSEQREISVWRSAESQSSADQNTLAHIADALGNS